MESETPQPSFSFPPLGGPPFPTKAGRPWQPLRSVLLAVGIGIGAIHATTGALAAAGGDSTGDWAVGGIVSGLATIDGFLLEWGPLAGFVFVEVPPVGVAPRQAPSFVRQGRFLRFDAEVDLRVLDARGATLHRSTSKALDLAELPSTTVLVQATGLESRATRTFKISNLHQGN